MKHTLEFDSFDLSFGVHKVLSSVFMQCETNEVTGLLGRNGSGKSCLMKIVFGSLQGAYKSVRIDGHPYTGSHVVKRRISYLPQHRFIPPFLKVREALKLYGIVEDDLCEVFPDFMHFMDLRSSQLSGGYGRLLEALLILKTPSWFSILDEPFSGLMPLHVEKLKEIIQMEKTRKGIIITDHMHRHIRSIADKLYVLSAGKTYLVKEEEQLVALGYLSGV